MTRHTILRLGSMIVVALAFAAPARAQVLRTFVSAQQGNDANSCTVLQPCRTFNVAIGFVSAGGEVVALDSGGYGPITVSKAVTLTGPSGVYVAITSQTTGISSITVSAASTDTVVLRGLTLTGLNGQHGINVTSVGNLHVEGCVISGFTDHGIRVNLTAAGSHIFVKDTIARNNGLAGIFVTTSTGLVHASIDNSRAERNTNGFSAGPNARVTISRSVASGNSGAGFIAASDLAGASSELSCERCLASNNGSGFAVDGLSGGTATIRASRSTATNNTAHGFRQTGSGVFESLVNNLVRGNGTDISGTITPVSPGISHTQTYAYDANGNRTSITYPSGRVVNTSFDFAGRPYSASSEGVVWVSSASYEPFRAALGARLRQRDDQDRGSRPALPSAGEPVDLGRRHGGGV